MMSSVRVEREEIIARPPEQTFERATDLAHYADWMPRTGIFKSCSHISDDPVRLGTTYIDRGRMGAFQGEVVEFERPSRVVYREMLHWFGALVVVVRLSYEFSPVARGTALHHVAESELHGVFRLMLPMVALIGRGERRRTTRALKDSLESEVAAATAGAA
jgi:uncharacterized protein YndB with AHSA1/START domain